MTSSMPADPLAGALSERARLAVEATTPLREDPQHPGAPDVPQAPDPGLVESLRHHLFAGETHYPERPGMPELREHIAARLAAKGGIPRGRAGVVITASEGESLFVTLLGLDVVGDGAVIGKRDGRHQALLDWLRVRVLAPEDPAGRNTTVRYYESGWTTGPAPESAQDPTPVGGTGAPVREVHAIGSALFGESSTVPTDDVLILGSLDGLEGFSPFRLGFVSGSPEVVKRITTWKQASSICSPGPSQRAALWALGVRP